LDRDVTRLVGPHDPGAASGQFVERGTLRMPELVAGTHADERVLRPEGRQNAVADRSPATVMAHLEHVDVAEHAPVDQRLQNVALRITGQHRREPRRAGEQHDA
jgi:hypothetical protein